MHSSRCLETPNDPVCEIFHDHPFEAKDQDFETPAVFVQLTIEEGKTWLITDT